MPFDVIISQFKRFIIISGITEIHIMILAKTKYSSIFCTRYFLALGIGFFMIFKMFTTITIKEFEVCKFIICFDFINMMNNFAKSKFASKIFFHNITMFKDRLSIYFKHFVALLGYMPTFYFRSIGRTRFVKSHIMFTTEIFSTRDFVAIRDRTIFAVRI